MKRLVIALVVLLLIIAVAAFYFLSNIDSIAKGIIEDAGTEVVGTNVSVESVSIKLTEGSASIKNLSVANPPGFSDQPAFRFNEISAVVDIGTGVVEKIYTTEPEIRVEVKDGRSNFEVLNKNIQESTGRGDDKTEKKAEKENKGTGRDPVQIQIDEVEVKKAKAIVTRDDGTEPLELTIDRLYFVNLKGSPQQIARVMLSQFVTQVMVETARQTFEKEAKEYIEEKKGELKGKLIEKLEKLLN